MINYPKFLKPNDTIGITAPSDGIKKEFDKIRLDLACQKLNSLGYKTIKTENVEKTWKSTENIPQKPGETEIKNGIRSEKSGMTGEIASAKHMVK